MISKSFWATCNAINYLSGWFCKLKQTRNFTSQTSLMGCGDTARLHMNVLLQCETLDWIDDMSASLLDEDSLERSNKAINPPAVTGAEWQAQCDISTCIISTTQRYLHVIWRWTIVNTGLHGIGQRVWSHFDVNSRVEQWIPSGLYRNK